MTITLAAAAIAAIFSTILTALWNQSHWSAQAKRITSTVFDVLLASAVLIATNALGVDLPPNLVAGVAKYVLIIGTVAAGAQTLFLKFKGALSTLEDATSLTPSTTDNAEVTGAVIASELPADTAAEQTAEDTSGTPPSDAEIQVG